MSQMDLALKSDLHPTYVSTIETGKRNVSLTTLYVLAASLGVSVADFFPGGPVKRPRARRT
ncbi:MAG: family transcriptional regulator [Frankiales bacterium]|nr:family transcriptional regulator [Frankiales bacterium]